jgi:hypothetical protein
MNDFIDCLDKERVRLFWPYFDIIITVLAAYNTLLCVHYEAYREYNMAQYHAIYIHLRVRVQSLACMNA